MIEPTVTAWYAPVFLLGDFRFVWFDRALVAETPERAKEIGLQLEAGYIKENVPIRAAHTVAKFLPEGDYALATLGPENDERPVIVIDPGQSEAVEYPEGQGPPPDLDEQTDPVEEIPYEQIADDSLIKTVSF